MNSDDMEPLKLNWKKVDRVSEPDADTAISTVSAIRNMREFEIPDDCVNDMGEYIAGTIRYQADRIKALEGQLEEERKRFKVISHRLINDLEIKLERQYAKLKHAYCGVVGSDSIVGLDCCDDYKEWLNSLKG